MDNKQKMNSVELSYLDIAKFLKNYPNLEVHKVVSGLIGHDIYNSIIRMK